MFSVTWRGADMGAIWCMAVQPALQVGGSAPRCRWSKGWHAWHGQPWPRPLAALPPVSRPLPSQTAPQGCSVGHPRLLCHPCLAAACGVRRGGRRGGRVQAGLRACGTAAAAPHARGRCGVGGATGVRRWHAAMRVLWSHAVRSAWLARPAASPRLRLVGSATHSPPSHGRGAGWRLEGAALALKSPQQLGGYEGLFAGKVEERKERLKGARLPGGCWVGRSARGGRRACSRRCAMRFTGCLQQRLGPLSAVGHSTVMHASTQHACVRRRGCRGGGGGAPRGMERARRRGGVAGQRRRGGHGALPVDRQPVTGCVGAGRCKAPLSFWGRERLGEDCAC